MKWNKKGGEKHRRISIHLNSITTSTTKQNDMDDKRKLVKYITTKFTRMDKVGTEKLTRGEIEWESVMRPAGDRGVNGGEEMKDQHGGLVPIRLVGRPDPACWRR